MEKRNAKSLDAGCISVVDAAGLIDFKIAEFVRLGGKLHTLDTGGGEAVSASIDSYKAFLAEADKVIKKIVGLSSALYPQPANGPDMPVNPPVFHPGAAKLDEAKKALEKAKKDAEDLEPEKAREDLKKAKELLNDPTVKKDVKEKKLQDTWFDILQEIGEMLKYLDLVI